MIDWREKRWRTLSDRLLRRGWVDERGIYVCIMFSTARPPVVMTRWPPELGIYLWVMVMLPLLHTGCKKRSVDKTGKPMAIHAKPTDLQARVRK